MMKQKRPRLEVKSKLWIAGFALMSAASASGTTLVNDASSKCVDVSGNSYESGARVHQWSCHGNLNQDFKIEKINDTVSRIKASHSEHCLEYGANNTQVVQKTCSASNNQQFRLKAIGGDFYQLQTRNGSNCLTMKGASLDNGAAIITLSCKNNPSTSFRLSAGTTPVPVPVPAPVPVPVPNPEDGPAQNFVKGLTFGLNVERGRAWYVSDFGSGTNGYTYYKNMGITHVRLFYPFPSVTAHMVGKVNIM